MELCYLTQQLEELICKNELKSLKAFTKEYNVLADNDFGKSTTFYTESEMIGLIQETHQRSMIFDNDYNQIIKLLGIQNIKPNYKDPQKSRNTKPYRKINSNSSRSVKSIEKPQNFITPSVRERIERYMEERDSKYAYSPSYLSKELNIDINAIRVALSRSKKIKRVKKNFYLLIENFIFLDTENNGVLQDETFKRPDIEIKQESFNPRKSDILHENRKKISLFNNYSKPRPVTKKNSKDIYNVINRGDSYQ